MPAPAQLSLHVSVIVCEGLLYHWETKSSSWASVLCFFSGLSWIQDQLLCFCSLRHCPHISPS